jgi:hypothetical protein
MKESPGRHESTSRGFLVPEAGGASKAGRRNGIVRGDRMWRITASRSENRDG